MNTDPESLNDLIEAAVFERGAITHLETLERKVQRRKLWLRTAIAVAASLIVFSGIGLKLGSDARKVGYAFDPVSGQKGGSRITALMQEREIDQAQDAIVAARQKLSLELANPSSSDPEYMVQLDVDRQELDLLEAVCALRKGQYFRARRLLKAIAAGGGAFAPEASSLLEQL